MIIRASTGSRGLASIDYQNVTAYISRRVRSQEYGGAFQVVIRAKTARRNVAEQVIPLMFDDPVRHVGGKPSGSNRIHLDIMPRPFDREIMREGNHATLAGMITNGLHGLRRSPANAGHRSHIDDLTALLLEHDFPGGLRTEKSSGQVGFNDLIPIGHGHLFRGRAPGDAGIVDKNVDAAELRHGGIDQVLHAGLVLHIAAEGQGTHADPFHVVSCLFTALFFARAQDEVGATLSQRFRHLATQPDRTTGDDGNTSAEIEELLYSFGSFLRYIHGQSISA